MDGIPAPQTSSLPPAMPTFGPPGAFQPRSAPQAPAQNPPGRPSADPVAQQVRAEQHERKKRLEDLLPAEMTKEKILVFKYDERGSKGRRPVLSISVEELREAEGEGVGKRDYIEQAITEKFEKKGRFVAEVFDARNRALTDYGSLDFNFEEEDMSLESDLEAEIDTIAHPQPRRAPADFPPPPSGIAPSMENVMRQVQATAQVEAAQKHDMTTTIVAQQNSQMQMMMQFFQVQQQQAEQRRAEEERRYERERDEQRRREERDEQRRREEAREREKAEDAKREREREDRRAERELQMQNTKMLMDSMRGGQEISPLIMKMLDNKNDREGTREMFSMMSESSKQALATQGEATKHLLASQAEASKSIITNVLGISQTMMKAAIESSKVDEDSDGEEPDMMEKFGKVMSFIKPILGNSLTPGVPAALPAPQQMAAPAQQHSQVQRAPAPRPQPTPQQYVNGILHTVKNLETGKIPVEKRLRALAWCAEHAPPELARAIRGGDEIQVLTIGQQCMDPALSVWLEENMELHLGFLRECVSDIQKILLGACDQQAQQDSIQKHIFYQQQKNVQPFPKPQAPVPPAPAESAPVATPAPVTPADAKPVESTVVEPAPTKPAPRRAPPPSEVVLAEPAEKPKSQEAKP